MENKYYVPDITEFRVGFEYEEKSSGLWTKQIYNEYSPHLRLLVCAHLYLYDSSLKPFLLPVV